MSYPSILVAIDIEDEAGAQLLGRRCRSFMGTSQAALHLVTVRTPLPQSYLRQLPKDWKENARKDAEAWLVNYAKKHGFASSLAGAHAPEGTIAREVVSLAEMLDARLILVAAHKIDLGRRLLGSNTQAIVRDAPCDVLIVREDASKAETAFSESANGSRPKQAAGKAPHRYFRIIGCGSWI